MRPITGLTRLAEVSPGDPGLDFTGCAATDIDPRIAEIADIAHSGERARELFDYLKHWEPPEGDESPPEQDALLPVSLIEGKLEIAASLPGADEQDDALKRDLHQQLRTRAGDLAQLAGNRFNRLAARSRSLQARLDFEIEALDMLLVHLDVDSLAETYARRDTRTGEDEFTPDVIDALADVARVGPGLTLDNASVELLLERKRRFEEGPPSEADKAAQDAMSRVVADDADAFGENIRDLERAISELKDNTAAFASKSSLNRNIVIVLGGLTAAGFFGEAGRALFGFALSNMGTLAAVAEESGIGQWFAMVMSNVPDFRQAWECTKVAAGKARGKPGV